ncbi:MAG: hypothetical protein HFP77_07905 [Methylococcales symbiont of Iophon sp. n. MRB-2018]|nr:MAG: hypothetical protein HFP77_07905 [Methylococcales symbiont of Iophon sp. n. MRB-2018]KAF3980185.1 MAG: hypothetical protein HFP76_03535 [Methylococcales symbiont of Iophon sp. n. MRB-2018]
MRCILYPIQQITLNERGLVTLCLGLILLACFYQQNDQEISVILPNIAYLSMVFIVFIVINQMVMVFLRVD